MARCLVLKAEDICDRRNCVKARLVYYYEHFAIFNEDFFRESEPRTVSAPLDICRDLGEFPGIYELIFAQEKEERPRLSSIKFVKPVDMWEIADTENEEATHGCSCNLS